MALGPVGEVLSRWGHDVSTPSLVPGLARESNFHEAFIDLAVRDAPALPWSSVTAALDNCFPE
ncbi:MAG: hypothetical protein OEM39_01710 [Acidimicrobiia bacterium]|nr:hypothetical protein [Acidimicrobiia bacterium]MDH3462730.1 hypothetical protein [Acidimicrobiia bacterium]